MKNSKAIGSCLTRVSRLSIRFIPRLLIVLTAGPGLFAVSGIYQSPVWKNPEGDTLPIQTSAEVEEFLHTAQVIAIEDIPVGVTKPQKVLLEKDGLQMHAIFRTVEVFKTRWKAPDGTLNLDFHDDCRFEVAAYKLSRLLGLHNVPPVVFREFSKEDFRDRKRFGQLRKREGTLQAWVEQAMTEKDRRDRKLQAPDRRFWFDQLHLMYLFENLIYDIDRNQGNILIGPDWRIWYIDSTRAFRAHGYLYQPEKIRKCDRTLFDRLKELSPQEIENTLEDCLANSEIRTLIERKEKIVQLIQALIDEKGAELVLVDF